MDPVIRIHPADDVVIARQQLVGGTRLDSEGITVAGLIPPGHKVAVKPIRAGQPVRIGDRDGGFQHVLARERRPLPHCLRHDPALPRG